MLKKSAPKVLFCDDDLTLCRAAKIYLSNLFDIDSCSTVFEAKQFLENDIYLAIVVDLNLESEDEDGLQLINEVSIMYPAIHIIVFSGDQNTKRVVEVAQRKNVTFIVKGFDGFKDLTKALEVKILNSISENALSPEIGIVLSHMKQIIDAQTSSPILITGETGTGKEFLAQMIAKEANKKVVAVNMATIPKETAESILFGHEKGSFTGAHSSKVGVFEVANHGILFLDEIGECDLSVQAKILRAIQEKQIQPLGSNRTVKLNFQLVAATHRNLIALSDQGLFRLDLYQRLSTFTLEIPPLRNRLCEIPHLIKLFLDQLPRLNMVLAKSGLRALEAYDWPGNIRELKSVVERIVTFSFKNEIDQTMVDYCIGLGNPKRNSTSRIKNNIPERELIRQKLKEFRGNKHKVANALKMGRTSLYRKIKAYKIKEGEYC